MHGWRFDSDSGQAPYAQTIARQRALVNYRNVLIDDARGTVFLTERGMRLDLGGIAKLYIVHAGMNVLRWHGIAAARSTAAAISKSSARSVGSRGASRSAPAR